MATEIWNGDGGDNDISTDANWVSNDAPDSADSMAFPAMAAGATVNVDGSDFSAVLLVNTTIELGCLLDFGGRDADQNGGYLIIDTDNFYWAGQGNSFWDLNNVTGEAVISDGKAADSAHSYGMSIIASNTVATMILKPGSGNSIGLAALAGEAATVTNLQILSGDITIGDALTNTTTTVTGGTTRTSSDLTTLTIDSGNWYQDKGKPTTLNINGGRVYFNSTTVPTTLNLRGGVLDLSRDARAKDWSAVTINYFGGSINDPGNIILNDLNVFNSFKGGILQIS